jgi:hypothetical protein
MIRMPLFQFIFLTGIFDEDSNAIQEKTDLEQYIDKRLFGDRQIYSASLLQSEGIERSLKIETNSNGIQVRIPELEIWSILLLNK